MGKIFIVNPCSGAGLTLSISEKIKQICEEDNINYKIYYTEKQNDAKEIAEKHKENASVYSVGGDGTLNEVVNGLVGGTSSLTIIPSGTGNDFVKSLDSKVDKIDVGKVNDRYFINVASLGMDANVAYLANLYKPKYKGKSYVLAALKTLTSYTCPEVKINNKKNVLNILAVCNGRYYGNGIQVSPDSILDDGKLNVCQVTDIVKYYQLPLFIKLLKGNHINNPCVDYYRMNNLSITSDIELLCNVDGEIIKDNNFKFMIVEKSLNYKQEDNAKLLNLTSSIIKH